MSVCFHSLYDLPTLQDDEIKLDLSGMMIALQVDAVRLDYSPDKLS